MSSHHYLAIDLGAESGRIVLGTVLDGAVALREIHRFKTPLVQEKGELRWDLPLLEEEILKGIRSPQLDQVSVLGISADSWAVDYVLLDARGEKLSLPYSYRDARTVQGAAQFLGKVPFAEVYRETGIQYLPFNTLYQLEAEKGAPLVSQATQLLSIADYVNARLANVRVMEESMASCTQIYNPRTRDWSGKLLAALGLEPSLLPGIVPSGTVLGPVTPEFQSRPGFTQARVVATCSHDTGAAVAAVPAEEGTSWAYISSGTWSLIGAELPAPLISEESRAAGFTNEVGVNGSIRFLKNIAGLWVVQECRRAWEADGRPYSYDELTRLATESEPVASRLTLDDPRFVSAGEMPEKIVAFCRETGQQVPATPGEFVRVILESLAQTYRQALGDLEKLLGRAVEVLHVVGGGSKNALLNQLTANATGIPVVAGPVEATALGNVLIQAWALGHLKSIADLRRVVRASFPNTTYYPQNFAGGAAASIPFSDFSPIHAK